MGRFEREEEEEEERLSPFLADLLSLSLSLSHPLNALVPSSLVISVRQQINTKDLRRGEEGEFEAEAMAASTV